MKIITLNMEQAHGVIIHPHARGVIPHVDGCLNMQTLVCRGAANQVYNHCPAFEWATTPIMRDVTEHPMFDLVPLARPRREMADRDCQAQFVR